MQKICLRCDPPPRRPTFSLLLPYLYSARCSRPTIALCCNVLAHCPLDHKAILGRREKKICHHWRENETRPRFRGLAAARAFLTSPLAGRLDTRCVPSWPQPPSIVVATLRFVLPRSARRFIRTLRSSAMRPMHPMKRRPAAATHRALQPFGRALAVWHL